MCTIDVPAGQHQIHDVCFRGREGSTLLYIVFWGAICMCRYHLFRIVCSSSYLWLMINAFTSVSYGVWKIPAWTLTSFLHWCEQCNLLFGEEQLCHIPTLCLIYLTDCWLIEVSVLLNALWPSTLTLVLWYLSFAAVKTRHGWQSGEEYFLMGENVSYYNKCDDT